MSFIGRASAGDSPFAIGNRALHDSTSPRPPQQHNPAPRGTPPTAAANNSQPATGPGAMSVPTPYSNVSEEARKRYEERYAKKRAEEEGRAHQEQQAAQQQQWAQQQQQRPPQGAPGGGYAQGGQYQRPPPQGYQSPPQQQQQQAYGRPPPQHYQQPSQQYAQGHPQQQQQQQQQQYAQQQQRYASPPQQQQQGYSSPAVRPQGYTSPPPGQQQYQQRPHSQQQQYAQSAPPPQQQQQYAQSPQGQQQQQYAQGQQGQQRYSGPYGQAQAQPQQAPVENPDLLRLFQQFDSSRNGQLWSDDLQRLLAKEGSMEPREDCIKMLMTIFDTDRSGSINFQEFEGLYRYIEDWRKIFDRFDKDRSGLIDTNELMEALRSFGFNISIEVVRKLESRFAPPPKRGDTGNSGISFDRFLMACVTIKDITDKFRALDKENKGEATFTYDTFLDIIIDPRPWPQAM